METTLKFGKNGLNVNLSDDLKVSVISKAPMPILNDPVKAVETALSNPIECDSLDKLAGPNKTACILICDITRPVPNNLILPSLLKNLIHNGLKPQNITILIATGLHRPNEGPEMQELIGNDWVLKTVNVVNHFARNDHEHVSIGPTSRNTPIKLDRRFVEADLKIVTGLVEPHLMAGWSGGRKVIAPGIAHRDTITSFHSSRYMEHPKCALCILDGNPLHEDQVEIVHMLGGALAVNVVLDDERRPTFFNFGNILASHYKAIDFAKKYTIVPIAKKFNTVVTSAAGYPLDKTYYQTVKGMVGALDILKPGGNLIIASECSEGLGSPEYAIAQQKLLNLGSEGFIDTVQKQKFAEIDEWQTQMLVKPMRLGKVHLYTDSLSQEDLVLTGVNITPSVEKAIEQSVRETMDTEVAIIPEGPYVVPSFSTNH